MKILYYKLCLVNALLVSSCVFDNGSSISAYRSWIDDERNGVMVVKQVEDVKLRLQWLPPELLVYQHFRNSNMLCDKQRRDSTANQYRKSLTFLLTLESADKGHDILWRNIATQEEFKERVHQLNFRMNEFISLEADGQVYRPVLHMLENDYGMTNARKIYLVFTPADEDGEMLKAKQYHVVFDDALFMTGITHFVFERERMEEIPPIGFWNCNEKKI